MDFVLHPSGGVGNAFSMGVAERDAVTAIMTKAGPI
jgi:NADPH-dependent ferric siderophore reductase